MYHLFDKLDYFVIIFLSFPKTGDSEMRDLIIDILCTTCMLLQIVSLIGLVHILLTEDMSVFVFGGIGSSISAYLVHFIAKDNNNIAVDNTTEEEYA